MTIERILGTDTGTEAFGKTDRNFLTIDGEKLPTSHNSDNTAHNDIRAQINNLDAEVDAHKAETIAYVTTATRDATLAGQQIISGFPFEPKLIRVEAVVNATIKRCIGVCTKTQQSTIGIKGSDGLSQYIGGSAIWIMDTGANYSIGAITINSDKTITINWTKGGTGATGTITLIITAIGHGGA